MKKIKEFENLDISLSAMVNYYLSVPEYRFLDMLNNFANSQGCGDEYHDCEFYENGLENEYIKYYDWSGNSELTTVLNKTDFVKYLKIVTQSFIETNDNDKDEILKLISLIESN